MNKYTAIGIATDVLINQKRIIVVLPRQNEVRTALDIFLNTEMVRDADVKVRRANGRERIDFDTGGSIIFKSARQTTHGYSVDAIYVEEDVVRHTLTAEQWEQWKLDSLPSLMLSQGELIIGY